MPNGVTPADPGLLSSIADELALPGFAVRNLMKGNVAGAGRNLADLALNVVDAPLPGDWLPEISGEGDRPEFSELIGPMDDGILGSTINIAGNILTDPVTYIPGAQLAKGAGMVAKGVKAITPEIVKQGVSKVAKPVGKFLRKTAGAERIGKPLADVITKAQGAKDVTGRAGSDALVEGLKGTSPRELEAAGEVLLNVTKDKATGALRAIDESDTLSVQDRLARYLMENPDVDPSALARIVETSQGIGKAQWESGKAAGPGGNIFTDVATNPNADVVMGALPGTTGQQGIREYFPRIFQGEDEAMALERAGSPNAIKGRKLETTQDVLAHLAANPELKLTTNVAEALSQRAAQQAELASRGATGSGLFGMAREAGMELPEELLAKALPMSRPAADVNSMLATGGRGVAAADKAIAATPDVVMGGAPQAAAKTGLSESERKQAREWLLSREYKQADPLMRETAEAIAKALPEDESEVALHFLKGLEKPGAMTSALGKLNNRFKSVAVYGAIVPKFGSITRNMVGALAQKYANPEARGSISPKNIPAFMRDWLASMEDGVERLVGKRIFTKNEFREMDEAFKAGGGDPRRALGLIKDPIMRQAAENGVFGNNFVDTEKLIAQVSQSGLRSLGERIWDWPAFAFKGAEQRMRYGLFKDLVGKKGMSPNEAARIVRSSFFDYSVSSAQNRAARAVIPFFQYTAKAVPQSAKLLAEKPWLASSVANLYAQGSDEPVMPNMQGKLNIPLGEDEVGNRQYLTGLGLPVETLSVLPNLSASPLEAGRDIEQSIVGSTSPLIKLAYSYISGRDPYFGSMPGSYSRVAGQDLGAAGSVLNQLLATGVSPAVAAQGLAGTAGKILDERTSIPEAAANLLTGAKIQSVDPDRAIQQRLQAYLERDPSIGQSRVFYDKGGDIDAQELLRSLAESRKALKDKQKAMANVL